MKKLNFKKLIALGLTAAAAVASFTACGTNATSGGSDGNTGSKVYRTLDEIKASGKINIGVFSDKNPFGYVDENGEYQGYDIYFANRLGKDLGVEINYVSTEAANRVEYLETGKVDIILANFTVTEERAEKVDFALPYMNVALGVVSPDSNVITSLDNWKAEDRMIVISGTTAELYLTKNYPDIKLQKYDSYATAKSAIENGNGVAWANDNTEVIAFATPIYYYEMSGQMKTMIDRANSLYDSDYKFTDIYMLTTAAEDEPEVPNRAIGGLTGWIDCFDRAHLSGSVFAGGVNESGTIKGHSALKKAYEMGNCIK